MAIFPGAIATDANLYIAVDNLSTLLTDNPLTSGATTVNVASSTLFPMVGFISIDAEIIFYSGKTATSFTGCTRGTLGTIAAAHVLNSQVDHNVISAHHNAPKDEIIAVEQFISDHIGLATNVLATEFEFLDGVTSNLQTQLNTKASNSLVVHLAGTETITGNKTFTGSLIMADPVIDVRQYASINAAITAIGGTSATLLISVPQTLTANLDIPANIRVWILKTGSIIKASTFTLVIRGPFEAGLYPVFSGFSTTDVSFQQNAYAVVYPQWWGATGNGSTDDTTALQSALNAGYIVEIPPHTVNYKITATLTYHNGQTIYGAGNTRSTIKGNITSPLLNSSTPASSLGGLIIRDLGLDNTSSANVGSIGLKLPKISNSIFENLRISNVETGIQIEDVSYYNAFYSPTIESAITGIWVKKPSTGSNETNIFGGKIGSTVTGLKLETVTNVYGTSVEIFTTGVEIPTTGTGQIGLFRIRLDSNENPSTGISIGSGFTGGVLLDFPFISVITTGILDLTPAGVITHVDTSNQRIGIGVTPVTQIHAQRKAASAADGIRLTNLEPGGWGHQIQLFSTQNFGGNVIIEAGRLELTGSDNWTSSATTDSVWTLSAVLNGTLTDILMAHGTLVTINPLLSVISGQIKFPATQNPSSGTNTLDDYEEGTWTPSLGGTATYITQTGTYIKIGKQVIITCQLIINTIGTGSTTTISGLPFTNGSSTLTAGSMGYWSSLATTVLFLAPRVEGSATTVKFTSATAAGTTATDSPAIFGSGARVDFAITYIASA